ncbi:MAG: hypothetical protein ACXAB7_16155 [Candidatus Kariarchaeaceae archaeon]|jgi:hypothetical protein
MASSVSGIQNFSKMNDRDKSYLVKLVGTIIAAFIAGIVTGLFYSDSDDASFGGTDSSRFGWLLWLISSIGLSVFIKQKYDLGEMTNVQIFRHGIFVGLLNYIFFWTVIFNFLLFA